MAEYYGIDIGRQRKLKKNPLKILSLIGQITWKPKFQNVPMRIMEWLYIMASKTKSLVLKGLLLWYRKLISFFKTSHSLILVIMLPEWFWFWFKPLVQAMPARQRKGYDEERILFTCLVLVKMRLRVVSAMT